LNLLQATAIFYSVFSLSSSDSLYCPKKDNQNQLNSKESPLQEMHQPTLQLCSLCVVPYFISMSEVTLLSSVGIKRLEIDRWNLGDEWRVSQSQREEEEEEEEDSISVASFHFKKSRICANLSCQLTTRTRKVGVKKYNFLKLITHFYKETSF
jgi:hypothetical protein